MFIGKYHTQGPNLEHVMRINGKLDAGQYICLSDKDGTNYHFVLEPSLKSLTKVKTFL